MVLEIVILSVMILLIIGFAVVVKVKGDSTYEQDRKELERLEKEFDAVDDDMNDVIREEAELNRLVASVGKRSRCNQVVIHRRSFKV